MPYNTNLLENSGSCLSFPLNDSVYASKQYNAKWRFLYQTAGENRLTIRCLTQLGYSVFPQLALRIMQFLSGKAYLADYWFQLYILHDTVRYCCKPRHTTEILLVKCMSVLISSSQLGTLWLLRRPQIGNQLYSPRVRYVMGSLTSCESMGEMKK